MHNPIRQVLEHKGATVERLDAEALVSAAVALMNLRNIGSVVVFDGPDLIGILTERDVLVRVVGERRDPGALRVGDVMTTEVVTISLDAAVEEALAVMSASRCRHLPVMDSGRVVGLVSQGDLTRWVIRDQERAIVDLTDYIHR